MQNGILSTWTDTILLALAQSVNSFLLYLPNIFGALIIFTIGWIVARIGKNLVLRLLDLLQLEPFAEKVGISTALKGAGAVITPSELIGEVVRWAVVLVFLNPTVEILGLSQVTLVINSVLGYIPNVIVSALILMFGVIFADLTSQFVKGTAAALGTGIASTLEVVTKYSIIIFVVLAALSQLGIAQQLIVTLFTGFVAMLAIAGGLAFGLGGQSLASDLLQSLRDRLQEDSRH